MSIESVWSRLAKSPVKKRYAILEDYQALVVRGETYPGLVARSGTETQGILILNVSHRDLQRLDKFEGKYYQRISMMVNHNHKTYLTEVYVFKQRYQFLLGTNPWDVEYFKRRGLKLFIRRYRGF